MATTFTERDNGFARMVRQAGIRAEVKVGILTDEEHEQGHGKTVAEIGEIHELIGVPTKDGGRVLRPWLRPVVDGRKAFIRQRIQRVAEYTLKGRVTATEGMRLLGFEIVRLVQARIRAGIPPELAESTKRRKTNAAGQTKDIPLIYTGQFIGAITAEARELRAGGGA